MILQVADVGVNHILKKAYVKEYTSALCMVSSTEHVFDDVERIDCDVRIISQPREQHGLIVKCFNRAGLL